MVDITAVFKACIETIRQRNKELSFLNSPEGPHQSHTTSIGAKSKIFPGKKSEYVTKARELSGTISSLRDFLQENRNAYLNIGATSLLNVSKDSVFAAAQPTSSVTMKKSNLITAGPTMTDLERDQIDNDVQKIVQSCQKRIFEYEHFIENTDTIKNNMLLSTHLESIANSLSKYLKEVTAVHSEMRAIRVKRTVDYKAMSRLSSSASSLHPSGKSSGGSGNFNKFESDSHSPSKVNQKVNATESEVDGPSSSSVPSYFLEDEIPPEELQILEEENAALLNELNSLANEVDQIQSNVVQIAQLQEIFTEKVLQQEKEIDKIANVVVGATENIKGGNEQIRQAIQKNADFRVWVLFFILVMSFSLLFLDWYND